MFIFVKNNGSTLPLITELTKISMLIFVFLNIQEQLRAPMNVKKIVWCKKLMQMSKKFFLKLTLDIPEFMMKSKKKKVKACKREVLEIRQLLL